MSEDKNDQNDQDTDEQQLSNETKVKYRKISDNELWKVFEDHKKWLESDETEGRRAELLDFDLSGKIFEKTDLSQAFFDRATFEKSDLTDSTLQKAIFNDANLRNINFSNTDLKGASFNHANLIELVSYKFSSEVIGAPVIYCNRKTNNIT